MAQPDTNQATTPPNNLEAEQAYLGALLQNPTHIETTRHLIHPTDHYQHRHTTIHQAILDLWQKQQPTDPVAVAHHLATIGDLPRIGGAGYLHDLIHNTPLAGDPTHWARIIHQHAQTRQLQQLGHQYLQNLTLDDPERQKTNLDQILEQIHQLRTGTPTDQPDHHLHWPEFLTTDWTDTRWITRDLLQPGGQIALVGDGKAGKSLFSLEWACTLATGRPFLGRTPDHPHRVAYLDYENPHDDLQRRLRALGYTNPDQLANLYYLSFPPTRPFDTAEGGADLARYLDLYQPDVVFIDTVSRVISGKENDADTWIALYRHALLKIKARGIASVRLDHFGKDRDRGARGNSAKNQDVDHVWELTVAPGRTLRLQRTYSRNGIGIGDLQIRRFGSPEEHGTTRHVIAELGPPQMDYPNTPPGQLARRLDELQVPVEHGRRQVLELLKRHRIQAGTTLIADTIKLRKEMDERRKAAGAPRGWVREPVQATIPETDDTSTVSDPGAPERSSTAANVTKSNVSQMCPELPLSKESDRDIEMGESYEVRGGEEARGNAPKPLAGSKSNVSSNVSQMCPERPLKYVSDQQIDNFESYEVKRAPDTFRTHVSQGESGNVSPTPTLKEWGDTLEHPDTEHDNNKPTEKPKGPPPPKPGELISCHVCWGPLDDVDGTGHHPTCQPPTD